MRTLSPTEATRQGYVSLTKPYHIAAMDTSVRDREQRFWRNLCKDFTNCNVVCVEFASGPELWRHETEINIDPHTGLKLKYG